MLLSAHFAADDLNLTTHMVEFDERYKLLQLPAGPFDYRMLPVLLWHALVWILRPLHAAWPGLHLPNLHPPFVSNDGWYLFALGFLSMFGTLTVGRRLLRAIIPDWRFEWLALGLGFAAYFDSMLVLNRNLYYPYDPPGLFFFTLLVYLAYRNRAALFCLTLAVAMLNKETAAMSVLIFFGLHFRREQLGRLLALCAGMVAIVIAVRLGEQSLVHHVCSTCNAVGENQLSYNISQLRNPLFWLSESSIFGFSWAAVILLWRYIPIRLRLTGITTYAIWFAGMAVVGVLREIRIFSELSALLLLLVASGIKVYLSQQGAAEPATP